MDERINLHRLSRKQAVCMDKCRQRKALWLLVAVLSTSCSYGLRATQMRALLCMCRGHLWGKKRQKHCATQTDWMNGLYRARKMR